LITNDGYTDSAIKAIRDQLEMRLEEKGCHTFTSSHEISGVITEEYKEVQDAVHLNDQQYLRKELIDIAVGAIWGIVSIDAEGLDW
jgi:hypothetical protein